MGTQKRWLLVVTGIKSEFWKRRFHETNLLLPQFLTSSNHESFALPLTIDLHNGISLSIVLSRVCLVAFHPRSRRSSISTAQLIEGMQMECRLVMPVKAPSDATWEKQIMNLDIHIVTYSCILCILNSHMIHLYTVFVDLFLFLPVLYQASPLVVHLCRPQVQFGFSIPHWQWHGAVVSESHAVVYSSFRSWSHASSLCAPRQFFLGDWGYYSRLVEPLVMWFK